MRQKVFIRGQAYPAKGRLRHAHRRTATDCVVTFLAVASSNDRTSERRGGHGIPLLPDPSPADLARAAAGDHEAFRLIVERYQTMVYSVAYNVLGDRFAAEDAAQDAFLRCYRTLPQYRSEASFSTWLFRVALTTAVDARRRSARAAPPIAVSENDLGAAPVADVDAAGIVRALADLPEDYRTPTVLRDVYGLPYQEIAELTGRPLGTVKVMVHRGRASLRLRLKAAGVGPQGAAGGSGGPSREA
jgi:RNA polymerase sigma-70 factor (ECF subfamily)